MKNFILLVIVALSCATIGWGQSIWTNPITAADPSLANPFIAGQTVDANIGVSGISRGTGITGSSALNRYSATSWNTAGIDLTAYFEFTLTPTAGCHIDFASFVYTGQASGTGATSFAFRSSLDGFTSNIGAPSATGTTLSLAGASYQNISSAITFRFYGWGASLVTGTYSINDFTFNGTTACGASNTITTGAVTGAPFAVNCSDAAAGTVAFTSSGTYNVGNIFTAQLSNSAGSFAAPTSIGTLSGASAEGVNPGSTISISIPAGTVSGAGYRIRVISSNPATTGSDNGSNLTVTLSPCTITTGAITGGPFNVDCSTGASGTVSFTSFGTFAAGNSFTVQISSTAGSFASPTTIGTFVGVAAEGTNPSGTISITIPAALASGAGYLFRIISSSLSLTSANTAGNTIVLSGGPCVVIPPHITSMLYDGCNVSCGAVSEGKSEITFGNTSDYSVLINATNVNLNYTTGGYVMTSTIVNNTATTTALNAAAGCAGLFLDGFGQTLPPNTPFMLVSNNLCVSALTWSNLCGTGPIYVIYAGAAAGGATWHDGGNFGNSGGVKSFTTTFIATDATSHTISYSYTAPGGATDGNYATWNENGGMALTQGNLPACSITPVVLPTTFVTLTGRYSESASILQWQTASEQNNDYFTISHSTDGQQFRTIGTVAGAGNSSELKSYQFTHQFPETGINYYKLHSTDYDGKSYFKGIVAVEVALNSSYYNTLTSSIEMQTESDFEIYSLEGKMIQTAMQTNSIPFEKTGLFLILNLRTGTTERLFIPEIK